MSELVKCLCDEAQEEHDHCESCDCVLTSHESEKLCRSCEARAAAQVKCPECDGDGYIEFGVPRPHNVNRDVGVIDVDRVTCETCHGDGTVQDED